MSRKLPISGKINIENIGKRLAKILKENRNISITIDLGSIHEKDKPLLNQILISILLLKSFYFSKNVIEIEENMPIFIELDSSFYENLKNEIEILQFLRNQNINEIEWKMINFKETEIQFITHYLKEFKDETIGKKDLIEDNIKDIVLPIDDCLNFLIGEFMKNKDKNYVSFNQFKIFTKVLYSLLTSFSKSGFFLFDMLSQSKNLNEANFLFISHDSIAKMRLSLIETLIISADQFTSKSIENVRNQQTSSLHKAFNNKEQKDDIKNNEIILNKAVVSWENFKPFFVSFTSDDFPLYVYKNLEDIPIDFLESIKGQMKVLNTIGIKTPDLVDYSKISQKELQLKFFFKSM